MPRFMDIHVGRKGLTQEQLHSEHQKDVEAQGSEAGVRFIKAWADAETGRVFCLSEGPDKAAIQRVHEKAGHPADEIYELSLEVE